MRRIVIFDRVSADGYFATEEGKLDWAVPDEELDKAAMQGPQVFDTILFGRRTYEMFEKFWPHVLDESGTALDPHHAGRRSPELRAMAVFINDASKVVFSKSLTKVTWRNSRLMHQLDPREVEAMKRQPGKDMIMFGSGSIASQLTQHGLVDEYQLIVNPVLLGSGRPLISGVSKPVSLELLEEKKYPSGNVKLRYGRSS